MPMARSTPPSVDERQSARLLSPGPGAPSKHFGRADPVPGLHQFECRRPVANVAPVVRRQTPEAA
jgi:hypothetical protein